MRKNIAAGNWKMNLTLEEATTLTKEVLKGISESNDNFEMILCVPAPYLKTVADLAKESIIKVGAQNMNENDSGAFTGEISSDMILSTGASHVIIGHSERRELFGETDDLLLKKLKKSLSAGLTPIFCCGEPLEIREKENQNDYVYNQLKASVLKLSPEEFSKIIIAYEPVWAIGTGKTASSEQAQEMHAFIRAKLKETFKDAADDCSILYGGSVKAANAKELFTGNDVDGGLVGGASLKADDFCAIANSF